MRDEERIARALEAKLRELGVDATASGERHQWQVTCEGTTRSSIDPTNGLIGYVRSKDST